ncbi:peptidoglycan DD-metalloendopeptidase family protein [Patescibacteria group bacterium]|nr:peptidoglycan DD-metalloendopeptidase family protein [Patescibacteria group bacterium]MDE1946520.1 peptidoglycan DD-metalloendopeptidase family protein [Patescibacteria group bacterium]MDE2010919.1 peptidoglycan DD-metalloendopeptidase family protein [Patescibacteria group bacterium]
MKSFFVPHHVMSICNIRIIRIFVYIILPISFLSSRFAYAQTTNDLQSKINQRNTDIQALEKEIAGYQRQIDDLSGQADTLAAAVKSLDLTQKKLQADISVTENKIAAKTYEIEQLSSQISDKEGAISDDRRIIANSLALINQKSDSSVVEIILGSDSVASAWNSLDQLGTVQSSLVNRINDLLAAKTDLETNKVASEKAKADLVDLNSQLKDQRQVVLGTQSEKNQLLKETKQSETQYKNIVAEKQAMRDAYEREVLQYESQLKYTVDTSKLPSTGTAILSWPLDNIFITQYFGNTPFATANSQIYGGMGHNGVDFRASIGTPVMASLSGVVIGVENTDIVPGCYSFGKWIMIDHKNGLSTLYAHLSVQSVKKGDVVTTGQIIGYSGNTGYTTGPHLHFGVYATQGVRITTFDTSIHCHGAIIPLASFNAYLNPLSYLPPVPAQ